jgi:capsular polysaccharide biosynthesis protein
MTYFAPGPSPRQGGSDGDDDEQPRRIGSQPTGDPRLRSRQPGRPGQPDSDAPVTAQPRDVADQPSSEDLDQSAPIYPSTSDRSRGEHIGLPPGTEGHPAMSRRTGPAPARPVAAAAYGSDDPPEDLAGLFPARDAGRTPPPTHAVIDLTRHERLIAASSEQPAPEFERSVPPGFPVELPAPSARREQLLLTAVSWLIVLFTTLLGALGGLTYSSVQNVSYTATASVIVYPPNFSTSSQTNPGAFATVFAQVATEAPVLQPALIDAGLSMSPDQARRHLEVSAPDGAALITIRAHANNAADAAALANAAATGISTYAFEHRAQTGLRVSKFTAATAPTSGNRPHRAESVAIGALIGLAVGGAIVLVIRRSRRTSGAGG